MVYDSAKTPIHISILHTSALRFALRTCAINPNRFRHANAVAIAATAPQVGAFALSVTSRDAALLLSLPPGNYSAQAAPADGGAGNTLIEVYDVP